MGKHGQRIVFSNVNCKDLHLAIRFGIIMLDIIDGLKIMIIDIDRYDSFSIDPRSFSTSETNLRSKMLAIASIDRF